MKDVGDIYYDIGKLWHSFYINDHMIKDGHFSIDCVGENAYELDIHRSMVYTEFENVLIHILREKNVNIEKAELIMCVVILSFAALHTQPYSKFAFYTGKYLLNRWYKKYREVN